MKYKVLSSAAHNFAHSFSSTMNVVDGGLTMHHLACSAVESGATHLHVDLLSGQVDPGVFNTPAVSPSIHAYVQGFGTHIQYAGADLEHITGAVLDLTFMLKGTVAALGGPPPWSVPFECSVTIVDDRGKTHVGRVQDVWHVDKRPTAETERQL